MGKKYKITIEQARKNILNEIKKIEKSCKKKHKFDRNNYYCSSCEPKLKYWRIHLGGFDYAIDMVNDAKERKAVTEEKS